jgi:hypothetical protein
MYSIFPSGSHLAKSPVLYNLVYPLALSDSVANGFEINLSAVNFG